MRLLTAGKRLGYHIARYVGTEDAAMDAKTDKASGFGQHLRQLREAAGLTQAELAERAGMSAKSIAALERGRRQHPHPPTVRALAQALGLSEEERAALAAISGGRETSSAPPLTAAAARLTTSPGGASKTEVVKPTPILTTKLYLPQPSAGVVRRSHLHVRLERGIAGALTVIAAPAGFGKTTLLADWIAVASQQSDSPLRPGQIAWLSLDATESDPAEFLRYLVAAIQTIAPAVGRTSLMRLHSAQTPSIETLLPLLVNELMALPNPSVLVLDDYHVIDAPAVHQALAFLLDHLPPQLHLIIATRSDPPLPLSRLRVRHQLTELRARDLRFTREEVARFLQEVMALPLTAEEVATLDARTEGWIAGLQLAALSLQDRRPDQMSLFIDAFSGSNRFVVDYLVDEVLARQPPQLQSFLLQTSILERMCGALCDAILGVGGWGIGDGENAPPSIPHPLSPIPQLYSQLMLEQLERSNLFIVPLDDERRWYRYHHLFAQLLRERLLRSINPEMVARLHQRASDWFEGQGSLVDAVQHAMAAQDWDRAARLIEQHGMALFGRGQITLVLEWLWALPDALVCTRPALCILHAVTLRFTNQLAASEARLQDAERSAQQQVSGDLRRVILGQLALTRGILDDIVGDLVSRLGRAQDALRLLPETESVGRAAALAALAHTYLVTGDVAPAPAEEARAVVQRLQGMGNLYASLAASNALAQLQVRQGRLRAAAGTYQEVEQLLAAAGAQPVLDTNPAYWFGRGDLLREWNQLTAAHDHLARGMEIVRGNLTLSAIYVAQGYLALARLHWAQGEPAAAQATVAEFLELARQRTFVPLLVARGRAAQAQLALAQGDLEAALHWADTSDLPAGDLSYPRELENLTHARVLVARTAHDPHAGKDAHALLGWLLGAAEAGGRIDSVIQILVLRALAQHAQGALGPALADLQRALALAAPEGYMRVFLDEGTPMAELLAQSAALGPEGTPAQEPGRAQNDPIRRYVEQILSALPRAAGRGLRTESQIPPISDLSPQSSTFVEPLTSREQEVVRLLAQGYSNQAIAQELIVAVGTVKRHVSNIMGKLQAESRLDVVARARNLGLA